MTGTNENLAVAVRQAAAAAQETVDALVRLAAEAGRQIHELRLELDTRLCREAMTPGAIVTADHMAALERLRAAGRLDALRPIPWEHLNQEDEDLAETQHAVSGVTVRRVDPVAFMREHVSQGRVAA